MIVVILMMVFIEYGYTQTPQTQPERITVKVDDLTPDQLAKIKADAEIETMKNKLETYGNWVGIGGEIGNGVKEALNAVVEVSDKFGKTDVGKFTLYMVAWKIIGKDLIKIVLGLIFLVVCTSFLFRHYRNNFMVKRIAKTSNGLQFWKPVEYEIITPTKYEGMVLVQIVYIAILFGEIGITYSIMFS